MGRYSFISWGMEERNVMENPESQENLQESESSAEQLQQYDGETMKRIAESALFMAAESLTIHEIAKVIHSPSLSVALKVIEDLEQEFNNHNSALEITRVGKSRYQMRVKEDYLSSVSHLAVDTDFSKAVLRTLGLIAVKQPVKQSIIVAIIGNKAYDYIKELSEKGFVHAEKQANTKLLRTTPKFESYFGKNIDDIKRMGD